MAKKYNLTLAVVATALLEGLIIYLNLIVHPNSQPNLTLILVLVFAAIVGFGTWYRQRKG